MRAADADFVAGLAGALPPGTLRAASATYLSEPRGRWAGQGAVFAPASTDEVAIIIRACAAARVGVVPFGGGTGLVCGQVQPDGPAPVILSLERMTRIRGLWPEENVVVVEAGAILETVQEAARDAGRMFPLTLASQGSARIGGLLSTNAGGVGVLRYGNARDLCLGIEAVMPDGRVFHGLKRLRKDNTGYDLRHLLCGAEGTLGVITAAALRLHPVPAGVGTAMLAVASPRAALDLLARAQARMAGCVSAFELIAAQGLAFLAETAVPVRLPFSSDPAWMVLIEVGLPAGCDPVAALGDLFAEAEAAGLVSDGVIASNSAQTGDFWRLREALPEGNRRIGAISSHDISLPLSEIPGFVDRAPGIIGAIGPFRINCFGHLGDGNLHYNVFPPKGARAGDFRALADAVKTAVHDLVVGLGGSFSAEHGLGRAKVADLERYGDPVKLAVMRAIKTALDPAGIMNPGAVLRAGLRAGPG